MNSPTMTRRAERRCSGLDHNANHPTTTRRGHWQSARSNDDANSWTTMRTAERRRGGPIDDTNDDTVGSMTTRTAQWQREGPNDDAAGSTTTRTREGPSTDLGSPIPLASGRSWAPWEERREFIAEPCSPFFYMYFLTAFMYLGTKEGLLPPWEMNTFILKHPLVTMMMHKIKLSKMR